MPKPNKWDDISYHLSNGISILIMCPNSEFAEISISFPNHEIFVFNQLGKLIEHHPAPVDCYVNETSCADLVRGLSQIFVAKSVPDEPLAPRRSRRNGIRTLAVIFIRSKLHGRRMD